MTAIAGLVGYGGSKPIRPEDVAALASALAHRGPDGVTVWRDDETVLVHAHLSTGQRPAHNLGDAETDGGLRIAGDIRLDNREEVARSLGQPAGIGDARLALKSYERWGPRSCERFLGDFAFAIWDARARTLFCARDPFGVRPLHYRSEAGGFAFATEADVLADGGSAPGEDAIAAYLIELRETIVDTYDPAIKRLPGGHRLLVRAGRVEVERYWTLAAEETSGRDAAETVRHRFETAVRRRLGDPATTGSMLSGGLDSSSITAVAARLRVPDAPPLQTFSLVYPRSPDFDETRFIRAVLDGGSYRPTLIEADDHAPLAGIEPLIDELGGLFDAPGLTKMQAVYKRAAASGVKVLLDGHGGDEVISHGAQRLKELAAAGDWLTLTREVRGGAETFGVDPLWLYLALFNRYGPTHRVGRLLKGLAVRMGRRRQIDAPAPFSWQSYLSEDFRRRTRIEDRKRSAQPVEDEAPSDRREQEAALTSPVMQYSFDILDRVSGAAGLEARYPFLDVELVSFCLGLPSHEKFRHGQTRFVLRQALKDVLPPAVRDRRSKTNFAPELARGLFRHHDRVFSEMLRDPDGIVSSILDLGTLRERTDALRADPERGDGTEIRFLWRAACLFLFLRRNARRTGAGSTLA